MDFATTSLTELTARIRERELTAVAVAEAYLRRVESFNPRLNAFLSIDAERVLEEARRADREIAAGRPRPLHGAPIAIKDIIDVEGEITTAGGKLLPPIPAERDAGVVGRLRAAGAIPFGRLNLHEYAWGGTTDNVHYGRCFNPWGEGLTPGGSSGGSGAAVAAGLCATALGTDTLGSIRIPASYCGVVGIKPTHGLVGLRGVFPLCWSLDTVGPLARTVEDAALVLAAIAGPDPDDPYSAMREIDDLGLNEAPRVAGLRLGVICNYALAHDGSPEEIEVREAVERAIERLRSLGARRVDLDAPEIEDAIETAYDITLSAAAAIHRDRYEKTPEGIGENVRVRLEKGRAIPGVAVAEAHHRARVLRHRFAAMLRDVDALVSPTTIVTAHAFDPHRTPTTARYTAAINLLGWPAISVPCGLSRAGLPIGLQIATPPFCERRAIDLARAFESAAGRIGPPPSTP